MDIIGFCLFGLLIGALGRMLAARAGEGWFASMAIGAAGALLFGEFGGFTMALLGAFGCVAAFHAILARRRAAARLLMSPVPSRRS